MRQNLIWHYDCTWTQWSGDWECFLSPFGVALYLWRFPPLNVKQSVSEWRILSCNLWCIPLAFAVDNHQLSIFRCGAACHTHTISVDQIFYVDTHISDFISWIKYNFLIYICMRILNWHISARPLVISRWNEVNTNWLDSIITETDFSFICSIGCFCPNPVSIHIRSGLIN